LGLFARRVGSLDKLNQALSDHGPESCEGFPHITVKQKPGQQTAVERNNKKAFQCISKIACMSFSVLKIGCPFCPFW